MAREFRGFGDRVKCTPKVRHGEGENRGHSAVIMEMTDGQKERYSAEFKLDAVVAWDRVGRLSPA